MVFDPLAHTITNQGPAQRPGTVSPRALIGTTIGDQLRLSNNFHSKVITVSLKDRSAIFPGGQRPNGAFWFDDKTGEFISSDYYFKTLPEWVQQFNRKKQVDQYINVIWRPSADDKAYLRALSDNAFAQATSLGKAFPHPLAGEGQGAEKTITPQFYSDFKLTPFASQYLANFAKTALKAEHLGAK